MKVDFVVSLGLLGAVFLSANADRMSPVTRVAELLESLGNKLEEELKQEEDIFDKYACWATTVISAKKQSNAEAQTRIDDLETYIADLKAGRIELTSERSDLEKELGDLNSDIETAEDRRAKEKKDFEAAEAELKAGIAALKEAIDVLAEATEGSEGSLITMKSELNEGFQERAADAAKLQAAVEFGHRFLSAGDAYFLQKLLTGDVPKRDWKKLNRKATFKSKYKARSSGIQKTLKGLLSNFQDNLDAATKKEKEDAETHKTLMTNKKDQKSKAEDALSKMEVEGGARGLSEEEAKAEIKDLKQQVKDDTKTIEETKKALEDKKEGFKKRKQLRVGEIAAVNKALAVIRSDDARDQFKKSFKSQGYEFLQQALTSHRAVVKQRAITMLRNTASAADDKRLVLLAMSVQQEKFKKVIEAIDKMVKKLKEEEDDDLKKKEQCEKDRADNVREAMKTSRKIDEVSDTIAKIVAEIEDLDKQMEEKKEQITKNEEELEDAKKIREAENEEWKASDADDKKAAVLVDEAKDILENFYKDNSLSLEQLGNRQAPEIKAGKAPPPPPSTWEGDYKGAKEESQGIIAILTLIKEDIEKDITKAKTEEEDAKKKFDKFKTDTEKEIETLKSEISTLEGDKADKETDKQTNEEDVKAKKGELKVTLKKIKELEPGCDYVTQNYKMRHENRLLEMDGLQKAKAILQGGNFPDS